MAKAKKKVAKKVVKSKATNMFSKAKKRKHKKKSMAIKAPVEPAIMDEQFDDMEDEDALDLGPSVVTEDEPGLF